MEKVERYVWTSYFLTDLMIQALFSARARWSYESTSAMVNGSSNMGDRSLADINERDECQTNEKARFQSALPLIITRVLCNPHQHCFLADSYPWKKQQPNNRTADHKRTKHNRQTSLSASHPSLTDKQLKTNVFVHTEYQSARVWTTICLLGS